jgi:hypothetical protein
MAKPKKKTKTLRRAVKKIAENVGPERRRVSAADEPAVEEFILEQARDIREKRRVRVPREEIIAIGRVRARGGIARVEPRGPKGKSKVKERSANAYRKQTGGTGLGRKKSTARKSGAGSGHRTR